MNETRCRYCKGTGYIMGMSHERWPCEECGARDEKEKDEHTPYATAVGSAMDDGCGNMLFWSGSEWEPVSGITPDAPEGWHEVGDGSWRCAELGVIWYWDEKGQALSTSLWSITDIPNVHVAALVAAEIDEAGGVSAVAMGPALFTVAWARRWEGKGGGSFGSRLARFWGLDTKTLSALGWAHDETPDLWWRPTPVSPGRILEIKANG